MNFENGVPIYHHGNKDSWSSVIQGTPISYENGIGYSEGLLSSMSGVNTTLAPRRPIIMDKGILSGHESCRAINLEQTHIGNGVVNNRNSWNGSVQNANDWIQNANGIGQSGNSWTPMTSEKVMNERSNMIRVDVQENQVETENWQDLLGMYTGLLQEDTLDTNKILEEINPTPPPPPPMVHCNVNQTYIANPTQYRNHTSNQASTSHSYLNTVDPANWKCNHLAAVVSPRSSSTCVLPANVAQNNGAYFSNRQLTSNRQSRVESQGMRSTSWSPVLGIQETHRLASNNLSSNGPSPKDGFPATYQTCHNEGSPPRLNPDAQTSSMSDSFPFAPITPDNQRKHMEGQWVPENVNFPGAETSTPAKVMHENETVSAKDAENLYNELLQTIGDSPASAISSTPKEYIVSEERDGQEIDLTQTPLQKTPTRRKKHRPKVIREGKPKRTPMPKDPENISPGETRIKRKYVRKKGINENTPMERVKRKYVRKKVADHLEPVERVGKRKYTRKQGVDHLESQQHSTIDDNVASVVETPPKSCKRQLNFDLEHVAQNENPDIKSSQQDIDVQATPQNILDRRTNGIFETPGNAVNNYLQGTMHDELHNQITPLDVIQAGLANRQGTPQLFASGSGLSLDEKRGIKRQNFNVNAMELYKRLLLGASHHAYDSNTLHGILLANNKKMKMQSELQARDDNLRQMNGVYRNISAMRLLNSCTGRVNPSYMVATRYLQKQQMLSGIQHHTMRSIQETSPKYSQGAIVNWNPSPPTPPKGFFRYPVTTYSNSYNMQIAKPNSYSQRLNKVLQQHRNTPLKGYQQSPPVSRGRPRKQNAEISVADITRKLEGLHIYAGNKTKQNELVLYRGSEAMIPFEPNKKRIPRPKVDLDPETERLWRVLMGIEGSEGPETINKDKEKWWEDERRVFRGRADSFIARMHLVQGDRRFSRWKGSVVDSVIGVFLTQNVSDHLSSSAFMSLAARFPLKSKTTNETCCQDGAHEGPIEVAEKILVEEVILSQDSVDSSIIQTVDELRSSSGSNSEAEDVTTGFETYKQSDSPVIIQNEKPLMLNDELPTNRHQLPKEPECILQIPTMNGINLNSSRQFQMGIIPGLQKVGSPSFEVLGENTSSFPSPNSGVTEAYDTCKLTNPHNETLNVAQKQDSAMFGELFEDSVSVVDKQISFETTVTEANSKQQNTSHELPSGPGPNVPKAKKGTVEDARRKTIDWDSLRKEALLNSEKKERSKDAADSLDYEALRHAHVNEISDAIRERGMNNLLADRMKDFLNRLVRDHGATDLEWLRDAPPDKAKEYLLSFRGLGLKSVECVRLLTLHHLAFPVDTNVGRIAVRLGWVPLQPLPESLQLHLLEMYPVLESIQKYLWPRLCKLDQLTLYELHYQMITFGKVFCTKSKPNCNACPMRAECRHFASAYASARLSLPGPEEKRIVTSNAPVATDPIPPEINRPMPLPLPLPPTENEFNRSGRNCEPIIEEPTTPEPEPAELSISDIEDQYYEDSEEIPSIKLNMEEFTTNLQNIMQDGKELQDNMSKALVALNPNAPSIPTPKLKDVSRLRTEHLVYELPDSHQLLEGLDKREPDDPSHYLLAIWTPGETATSVQAPEIECSAQQSGQLCDRATCFSCNNVKEANLQVVRGTILIPCRTAMRGSFPLNGTYFQVNEMFADHASSLKPIDVPRSWIWNLPRRTVYFGTSVSTIFKGLNTEGIQYCFWRGFVCVRGFDRIKRAPRPLMARLHFPVSKLIAQKAARENK